MILNLGIRIENGGKVAYFRRADVGGVNALGEGAVLLCLVLLSARERSRNGYCSTGETNH